MGLATDGATGARAGGATGCGGGDVLPYLVFGVLTTAVNVACYWLCAHPLGMPTVASSVAAWVASVAFAYVTNRRWVFHSDAHGAAGVARECAAFFAGRLATGCADWGGMWLLVDVLALPDMPVKVALNALVVALNYAVSKLLVFGGR